jgi:hypothetical protein
MRLIAILIFLYALAIGITDAFKLPIVGKKFQPAEVIFLFLAGAWLYQVLKRKLVPPRLDGLDISLMIFVILEIISAAYHNDTSMWLEVIASLYLLAVYFILKTYFIHQPYSHQEIHLVIMIAGGMAAILGITGWVLAQFHIHTDLAWPVNSDYPYFRHVGRATGLMTGPNMLHNFLSVCFLWLASLWMSSETKKIPQPWLWLMIAAGIILCFSKNTILLIIACIFLWNLYHKTDHWSRLISKAIAFILLVIYMLGTHFVVVNRSSTLWKDRLDHSYFIDDVIWSSGDYVIVPTSYSLLRTTAVQAGLQNPVFGIGPGAHFRYVAALKKEGKFPAHFENYDPHSVYLGAFATMGFAGLIAIIWITVYLWKKLVIAHAVVENRPLVPFLQATMLFMFLDGINMDILHFRHLWIILALVGAILYWKKKGSP